MAEILSVYRTENKYIISKKDLSNLMFKLDKILKRDNHSKMQAYKVRSLYFDSINNIDFKTKLAGTEIRKKIRIRTYDAQSEKCKLEMKQKNGDLQHKISMWITKEDAKELINRNYSVLTKYFEENKVAIEFYTTMLMGVYGPVALIEYDRIAYTYNLNNTRITFDMDVRASESNYDIFSENPIYTKVIDESDTILEIKYDNKLVDFISDVFKPYKLTRTSVSKYCIGRKVFYDFNF
ncbi:MAG: polyphosphate polymerase domain-containing protein [Clostridia bacterium]|nr:polyphosphate polymerase domain-containing protein [Clostridia bacterium]